MSNILISDSEKEIIEKLKLSTGLTYRDIKNIFECYLTHVALNYVADKSTSIPFIGDISFSSDKDKITKFGKQAIVKTEFTPNDLVKKLIGEIKDKKANLTANVPTLERMIKSQYKEECNDIIERR